MKQVLKAQGWGRLLLRGGGRTLVFLSLVATAHGQIADCTETALRQAVAAGGYVSFTHDCTILLTRALEINTATVLDNGGYQVTISGGGATRLFVVSTNVAFTLQGITLTGGFSTNGGAILNSGGSLRATNCTFLGNAAWQPTNTIVGNTDPGPPARGGAIQNQAGDALFENCTFVNNSARGAAGNGASPHCGSEGSGGAIYNSGNLVLSDCTLSANLAQGGMAGAMQYSTTFTLNAGDGNGGAICNPGTLLLVGTTVSSNSACGGLGGFGYTGGTSPGGSGGPGGNGQGAGIFNSGTCTIYSSALVANTNAGGAGGPGGTGAPSQCPYPYCWPAPGGAGGTAGAAVGAGLYNSGVSAVCNSTLAANQASGGRGGPGGAVGRPSSLSSPPPLVGSPGGAGGTGVSAIFDKNGGVSLTNCTIAWNAATGGTGGQAGWSPVLPGTPGPDGQANGGLVTSGATLINTLLATNLPLGLNCIGKVADAGHNLSSDGTPQFADPTSHAEFDPRLGDLGFHGGPTLTVSLLPGSWAIDMGNASVAPRTDQRGRPRPAGPAADIGAFECAYAPVLQAMAADSSPFAIHVFCDLAGTSVQLESSTNLLNWEPLGTGSVGRDGEIDFEDSQPSVEMRFYRTTQNPANSAGATK